MKNFTTTLFAKRFMGVFATVLIVSAWSTAWAQLPYNTEMTNNHFKSSSTVTTKEGTVNWDSGIRLGTTSWLNPGNWDEKYVVIALAQTSIPYQLKFKYKCNFALSSNANWYISESSDNSTWMSVWSTESNSTSTSDWQTVDLSKSTKYLKLCFKGNYSGTYSNIIVSDQAFVHDPIVDEQTITSLDFGTGSISSGTKDLSFDVEWCNVEALSVSVNNTDYFAVTPASFGGKVQYGTQTVTVTYDRDKAVGEHSGTITMTNGSITKTITVSGKTTLRPQGINWNAELEATAFTLNAEDELTGEDVATADNEEAEVTFSSSNEDVIAVSPDKKTIVAVGNGTAEITVTATGNEIYDAGTDTKTFTVTALKKQSITWEQNLLGLKTNDSPNTVALEATATSGGTITYAIEGGSASCITLGGENNATLTITGTPGEAYIIATQAGGVIGDEEWISATARKLVKVRDPQAACDEYALADQSFSFEKSAGMKQKEFSLTGKPTQLTFYAKYGGKRYAWSEQEPMLIEQYANFGSGLEWKLVESIMPTTSGGNFGPYALEETATKIRFRSGEYGSQNVSSISVPRKKELVVSESTITEDAERNVKWSKTVSVSRSNIDVVDIIVSSDDENCPFTVSKNSIGQDCADRTTETFEIYITPREKNTTYTGTVTITDGKATPTTHTIDLSITAVAFNQSITGFDVPETVWTTDQLSFTATASSGYDVTFSTSNENIARIVDGNKLEIITSGEVKVIAYQAGDDKWNEVRVEKSIVISKVATEITSAPTATGLVYGQTLAESELSNGEADVDGTFAWEDGNIVPNAGDQTFKVIFTPANAAWYETSSVEVTVHVEKGQAAIVTAPTATPIAIGQTLADAQLVGGVATFEGTFVWADQTIEPESIGEHEYAVNFVPANADNYNGFELTVKVTVNKQAPAIIELPTASEITYGQTLANSTLNGGEAAAEGTFAWADPITAPNAGTAEYPVIFTPFDTENYGPATLKVSVTVAKAESEVLVAPRPVQPLGYTGEAQTLILAGEAKGGTMVYSLDGENFSEELPTATEIGDYTVYFRVAGDANHNDSEVDFITAAIVDPSELKETQTIIWEQELGNMTFGQSIQIEATSDSGNEVYFEVIAGDESAWIDDDNVLWADEIEGLVKIRAYVMEDATYYAAEIIKEFYVVDPMATAIDQTSVESKAQKLILNGQLLIIRDGRTYNAAGVLVK